ncbi:hypothetical protein BQ8482_350043 [Mesorhizobium delmotii]|uniref:Uncharacterized protein n=1 Tax=Mesorhizobium delmotii TaxID=1631247 RepID=A0A2P9AQG9_9HYPH|nr:hypothetical protein BQ8482_350043 [Mesorhizobium delmotii]
MRPLGRKKYASQGLNVGIVLSEIDSDFRAYAIEACRFEPFQAAPSGASREKKHGQRGGRRLAMGRRGQRQDR